MKHFNFASDFEKTNRTSGLIFKVRIRFPICTLLRSTVLFVFILCMNSVATGQQSFINKNGVVQYFITNNDLGVVVVAPQYFSISQQDEVIFVTRASVAGLPPDFRMIVAKPNVTLSELSKELQTSVNEPGMVINPIGQIEGLEPGKIGIYFSGSFSGTPIDGYIVGMVGPYQTGVMIVNMYPKPGMDVYTSQTLLNNHRILVKSGATDQANGIAFYKPGTSFGSGK